MTFGLAFGLLDAETLLVKVLDIASAPLDGSGSGNFSAAASNSSAAWPSPMSRFRVRVRTEHQAGRSVFSKRAVCWYIAVVSGYGCALLAAKCGIWGSDFTTFNAKTNFCSTLKEGDYVCCSAGGAYTPLRLDAPKPNADGTCAAYFIQNTDICVKLAAIYSITCGPLVPGTQRPTDPSVRMTDLNPCPSSTCISNCGNEIKKNSGPPANFSRIGYYESWNMGWKCLWLKAENANTDGTYTHIHWGFADIDPTSWTLVINDTYKQWGAFKRLTNVKRIVSLGGWTYSTEPAMYNIIRQAIIANCETFATNMAKFVEDERIDGVDIDWEYPGAPDILVGGVHIGQPGDGVAYLRFLTTLKAKLPSKSVSIAAPASYWYLKVFPIDRIAAVIDCIVYMTYDLHGQWDYGNVNAFDSCPSGKCIRSHVNLTETRITLSIITKAGVPNNKIVVGESNYGRSFHMAVDGYTSNAEINDIIRSGQGQQIHDTASDTDVLIYMGDYISYMTPSTKNARRTEWKGLNFAGSIDWAVDLQAFGREDSEVEIELPAPGEEGCVMGESGDLNADALCQFTCYHGFCPEPACFCTLEGPVPGLPVEVSSAEFVAWDEFDVQLAQLCKFACKYGFCPEESCTIPVVDEWDDGSYDSSQDGTFNKGKMLESNAMNCMVYKGPRRWDDSVTACSIPCGPAIEAAKAEGRTTNYGCGGHFPLDQPILWIPFPGAADVDSMMYAMGKCFCDNLFINTIADTIIEALPIIAQIGCYIVMSTIKLIVDLGTQFIPGVGKSIDSNLDATATAAQLLASAYPEGEDPAGAFEWWLSPCGGSDLVPDDIKKAFDILSNIADGVSSYKPPKNIKKGSGKKGDAANPTDRSKPKPGNGSGPKGTGSSGVTKKRKCKVPGPSSTRFMRPARNTLRVESCDGPPGGVSTTTRDDIIITSLSFGPKPTLVEKVWKSEWGQACYHYSSAIAQNPKWNTVKCPHGTVSYDEKSRPGPTTWRNEHHKSWRDAAKGTNCQVDEYPPRYLLANTDPEMINAGKPGGQLMRMSEGKPNGQAANGLWAGVCFSPHIAGLTVSQFRAKWKAGTNKTPLQRNAGMTARGYVDNVCWPDHIAAGDPGYALFSWDNWYNTHSHLYDFSRPYQKGSNGS
ncbi:glycoside hydrolase family 18 protein [Coniochaeta sp. 2T2.1]|nr:glycoside hydrolase family 18 protein [Coniochaeta sp. 2T2.1]